jgi:archaetidylinositol phosphate synthase
MLYQKRKRLENLSIRLGRCLSRIPLSPNQWTALSLLLVLATFYLLSNQSFFLAAVTFAFAAFIDMIDGAVARESKQVTKVGGYLDSVADRVIEFVIILGLFINGYQDFILPMSLWLFLLFFGSFMSTYTRAAAFEKGVYKDLKGGILEHTDRLAFFLLIIVVSVFSLVYASYLIVLMAVITNVSALQRFLKAIKR